MATNATITTSNFNISKISFGKPAKNTYGLNTISVLYDGSARWGLQLPKLRVPYSPSAPMRKEGEPAPPPEKLLNYSLDFSLAGYKETEKSALVESVKRFYDILVALNERCISEMVSNSEVWLDIEEASPGLCQKKFYRTHIREPTDKDPKKQEEKRKKYAPTFRAKLGVKEGNVLSDIINATDNEKVKPVDDVSTLLRGSESQAIVQCAGLVYADGKWGFNWRIHKMKVWPSSGSSGFDFQDDEEGETIEADFVEEKPAPVVASNQVQDEEDDEEDELDTPPAPVRQPEPPKEVVIKKAVRKTAGKA